MNGNGFKDKKKRTMALWTYPQAQAATHFLSSILRSLREAWLEAVQKKAYAERLTAKPGRSDRQRIMEEELAHREARLAFDRYLEAREELEGLGVACLEPHQGVAWIPFAHDNQLAWFVFDIFDEQPIRFWRLQADPLEMRRSVADIQGNSLAISLPNQIGENPIYG
jgi:hypothetical protein